MNYTAITPGVYNADYPHILLKRADISISRSADIRMSRTKNMDGTTTVIRSGYSTADETISLSVAVTGSQEKSIRYWAENDIAICVFQYDHALCGYIKSISGTDGKLNITLWPESNFSIIEPEDDGGGGGGEE